MWMRISCGMSPQKEKGRFAMAAALGPRRLDVGGEGRRRRGAGRRRCVGGAAGETADGEAGLDAVVEGKLGGWRAGGGRAKRRAGLVPGEPSERGDDGPAASAKGEAGEARLDAREAPAGAVGGAGRARAAELH